MSVKVLVQLALVGVLAVGTLAFARSDRHVTLSVDGVTTGISSRADTVSGLLEERGLSLGARDSVTPAPDSELADGATVTVRHARLVTASVDGHDVQVWTTALTVGEAVAALGIDVSNAAVTPATTAPVPTTGMSVDIELPDRITIKHDNRRTTLTTTARTVGEALTEAGVDLGPRDLMSGQRGAPLVDGTVVTVTRVGVGSVRVGFAIPHRLLQREDPTLYEGIVRTVREGHDGKGVVVYRVVRHDGLVVRRSVISRRVIQRPVARVVRVGTKPRPAPAVSGSDGLNWAALAQCESGGNPGAVNGAGYYGLYQFSLGTWASVGGSGNPVDASADEQTYRAKLLFQRSGSSPWPVCGRLLYS